MIEFSKILIVILLIKFLIMLSTLIKVIIDHREDITITKPRFFTK